MTMDAKLKADWVKALRSGEYEQTTNCLRNGRESGFCCLGVLADIQGARWENDTPLMDGVSIRRKSEGYLKENKAGNLSYQAQRELALMNDRRLPFSEIANFIEKNL